MTPPLCRPCHLASRAATLGNRRIGLTVSVLFVCLGNICRSPLAEAALRAEAERAGLAIAVDSAGTGDWHVGTRPDARAQAPALRHGNDIAGYRARQVTPGDFTRFTHIFALDPDNLA